MKSFWWCSGVLAVREGNYRRSLAAQLLRDIALVLDGREGPMPSGELVAALVEREESPWGDLRGRPLDVQKLAHLLRYYGIRPKVFRVGKATLRGYSTEDFPRRRDKK